MPLSLRSLSPTFIRGIEIDYEAPLVTVSTSGLCPVPPEVDAGDAQVVGGLTASLAGTASSACGKPLTYLWSYVSGPGEATFADDANLNTDVTVDALGIYYFKLTVADDGWTVFATVAVMFV